MQPGGLAGVEVDWNHDGGSGSVGRWAALCRHMVAVAGTVDGNREI